MKIKKEQQVRERGITLIALVITIIILLILTGITIGLVTGENGILAQATRATEATEIAQENEKNILDSYENVIYEATNDVPQVNDSNPGVLEGSGTEEEPFVINSIEDLIVFADNVTKGINTYQDQYVELGSSLDFNSYKSYVEPNREDYAKYGYNGKLKEVINTSGFIPIGTLEYWLVDETLEKSECYFCGNFNGKGYKIYNLKILQEKNVNSNIYTDTGLFSENFGVINNVYIENGMNITNINGGKFSNIGLLVGENNGEISRCYVKGEINTTKINWGNSVGGIVGANNGTIKECYNATNINAKYSCKENRIGGIVGVNEIEGKIENCYNKGKIDSQVVGEQSGKDDICLIGGIAGRNIGSIKNVYSYRRIK